MSSIRTLKIHVAVFFHKIFHKSDVKDTINPLQQFVEKRQFFNQNNP